MPQVVVERTQVAFLQCDGICVEGADNERSKVTEHEFRREDKGEWAVSIVYRCRECGSERVWGKEEP
jgi:hypothetical protein